jgi:RNase P/RNase MRP subunit p30
MLKKGSVVYDNVVKAGPQNAVDVLFISVLTRKPSSVDRDLAKDEINHNVRSEVGYGNVLWALLNTREFLFIQ